MSSEKKVALAYAVSVVALIAINWGSPSNWQSITATIALVIGAAIIFAPTGGKP